jgi:hypothetical protein
MLPANAQKYNEISCLDTMKSSFVFLKENAVFVFHINVRFMLAKIGARHYTTLSSVAFLT